VNLLGDLQRELREEEEVKAPFTAADKEVDHEESKQ